MNGAFNEMANFNGMAALETPEFMRSKMDEFGSPSSYNHYSVGWAWAMNTPFQWTKQVASHWGGTRNGTIVHWPDGIAEQGGLRSQFTHVIDVAPDDPRGGRACPSRRWSTACSRRRSRARSMLYSFDDAEAPERHDLQYFEMFGNRGIYHRGWSAVTKHKTPWLHRRPATARRSTTTCGSCTTARRTTARPATSPRSSPSGSPASSGCGSSRRRKYNVLPLDDRTGERLNPELAGRPTLIRGNSQLFFPGMGRLSENSVVSIKNKSFSVTAEVDVPEGGADGRDHRPGRALRRLGGVRQGRPAQVRLQRARHPASSPSRPTIADAGGQAPGPDGVRLRRRRARQGRRRHAVPRRHGGRAAAGWRRPSR